jgi:hypothetical protein
MFLFATTQAISASRAKDGRPAPGQQCRHATPRAAKGLFSRLLEVLAQPRLRRVRFRIERQRGVYGRELKK